MAIFVDAVKFGLSDVMAFIKKFKPILCFSTFFLGYKKSSA